MAIVLLCEILADLLCKFPLVPTASHHVILYHDSFLLKTVKDLMNYSGFPLNKCTPFMEFLCQRCEKSGSQIRGFHEYCQLFIDCYGKLMPCGALDASQAQVTGPTQDTRAHQAAAN